MNRTVKDAIYGVIGGIVGTAVITKVMMESQKLQSEEDTNKEKRLSKEVPTEKLARKVSEGVGVELKGKKKQLAGQAVHWSYGAFWGGVYGILRKRFPAIGRGMGLPFGVSLAAFGDALMLPAMGLTPPATKYPVSVHARSLASHFAYAATIEGVCELCDAIEKKVTNVPVRTNPDLRRVS